MHQMVYFSGLHVSVRRELQASEVRYIGGFGTLLYELKGDISPPCRKSFCGKPLTLSELNEQVDEVCTRDHYDGLGVFFDLF